MTHYIQPAYQCSCGLWFLSVGILQEHQSEAGCHGLSLGYQCEDCGGFFFSAYRAERHSDCSATNRGQTAVSSLDLLELTSPTIAGQ